MRHYWLLGMLILLCGSAFTRPPQPCVGRACQADPPTPRPITQPNPALGWSVLDLGSETDQLSAFVASPMDEPYYIPNKGRYMDPERGGPHFGVDFTDFDAAMTGTLKPIHPLGPGIVTAVHPCVACWADGGQPQGQIRSARWQHNFGYGGVLVLEHPVNEYMSFYSLYAHLQDIYVIQGQQVDATTTLANMGISGDAAGFHVHIEVRFGAPGLFWGADFSDAVAVQRWVMLEVCNPTPLLNPETHGYFLALLENWLQRHHPEALADD
ncbi:MAG: M23 family metallopeptidase [Anaerolineae bacterium]|nr:M23 family metallopeptidase [Anaerolineae bacterium]